jgi:hypothetical protein
MHLARSLVSAALALAALAAACSSTPPADASAPPRLSGLFRPNDATARIHEIEFYASEYRLEQGSCTSMACEEHGTFTVDWEGHALSLVADSGRTSTLRFDVMGTRTASSPSAGAITPRDEPLTGAGSQLTTGEGSQLVSGEGSPLIVESVTLLDHTYKLDDTDTDKCDDSGLWPPVQVGTLCNGGAYGFAHCYLKGPDGCQSDARSCLSDTSGKRWDDRASQCSELHGVGKEGFGPGGHVVQACCKG